MLIFLIIQLIASEETQNCPPKPIETSHDISRGNYSFTEGESIYGCHVESKNINANNCALLVKSCSFQNLRSRSDNGGAICLTITDYFKAPLSLNEILNCDFKNCFSATNGGAIYLSSMHHNTKFIIQYCHFIGNGISFSGYKENSIYFAAASGTIQYCVFICSGSKTSAITDGSAIFFNLNIDSKGNGTQIYVTNNQFTQTSTRNTNSMINIDISQTVYFNFKNNSFEIQNNENSEFRLFRNPSPIHQDSSLKFENLYLSNTGSEISDDNLIEGFPITKDEFVKVNNSNIEPRPEEPGPLPPDDTVPLYYMTDENCNKNNRCKRSVETVNQVLVIVLVTNFNGYSQQYENGGAIYVFNCGLKCNNTKFFKCSSNSGCGGAIYFSKSKLYTNNLTFNDLHFSECSALYGGAVYIFSSYDPSLISIDGCAFDKNAALAKKSNDQSKFGGSAIFVASNNAKIENCVFKGSKGPGGLIKVLNVFEDETLYKRVKNEINNNLILIRECSFESDENSLFYVGGKHGSVVNVHDCVFKGIRNQRSKYIDGLLIDKKSQKIFVESCNFDIEFKLSVNLDLIQNRPSSSSSSCSNNAIFDLVKIGSFIFLALVVLTLLFISMKKIIKNDNHTEELQEPLNLQSID